MKNYHYQQAHITPQQSLDFRHSPLNQSRGGADVRKRPDKTQTLYAATQNTTTSHCVRVCMSSEQTYPPPSTHKRCTYVHANTCQYLPSRCCPISPPSPCRCPTPPDAATLGKQSNNTPAPKLLQWLHSFNKHGVNTRPLSSRKPNETTLQRAQD